MYNTNLTDTFYTNRILATGVKLYELVKLAMKPSVYKNNNSKEYLPFILNAISKGYTVLDVGSHRRAFIFDMLKISKLPGKLIAFEPSYAALNYLQKMKQLLKLENITIDQLPDKQTSALSNASDAAAKRNYKGATVIDFNTRLGKQLQGETNKETVDYYCAVNFIIPALIKIKLEGNDLGVLHGCREMMRKYKPQILIESAERAVSRDTLLTVFKMLTELNYAGYFILDTIKVPIASFDFNIYQNEVLGYYCNSFLFE
jgi:FkbM family methyltransferase